MDQIGVFTPEQARELWQDYQSRRQLPARVQQHYPERRPIDEVSPHRVFVKNTSGETCPAYGCMQITGVEIVGGRTVVTITKPTSTDGEYLFNSQFAIATGNTGWAYRFGVVIMLGDPPSAVGVTYQPIIDSWEIEEGGESFVVFGEHNADARGLIGKFSGGGGGGHHIWFTIDEVYCEDAYDDWHLIATPNWYTRGCTATPPGADEYTGQVKVYDICDIHGYYNADELPGSKGRATYMYPLDGECEPRWILDTLCKQPECA